MGGGKQHEAKGACQLDSVAGMFADIQFNMLSSREPSFASAHSVVDSSKLLNCASRQQREKSRKLFNCLEKSDYLAHKLA